MFFYCERTEFSSFVMTGALEIWMDLQSPKWCWAWGTRRNFDRGSAVGEIGLGGWVFAYLYLCLCLCLCAWAFVLVRLCCWWDRAGWVSCACTRPLSAHTKRPTQSPSCNPLKRYTLASIVNIRTKQSNSFQLRSYQHRWCSSIHSSLRGIPSIPLFTPIIYVQEI